MSLDTFAPVNPAFIDVAPPVARDGHSGYPDSQRLGDTRDVLKQACGAASREFPKSWWIEPKDWADKARENDKNHTWPINYLDRFTNQNPTHECTCHSLRTNAEVARNAARGIIFADGPKKDFRYEESANGSVWLSPLSIYAEANPGEWGGANVRQVLEIACRRGFLPDKIQPRDYGFKHAIQGTAGEGNSNQSHGPWLPLSQFPAGWQDTAKWLKPQEVVIAESWEQAVCIVLNGRSYSVGRSGHAVPWTYWSVKENAMAYVDSYNVVRWDSLRTVKYAWDSGGFSIVTMTTPDDWLKPVG